MTTLAELVNDVYTLTNRPDLVNETALAVKNATLKMHRTDYYFKDLFETGIQFTSAEYLQSLDYKKLLSNWRSLKYIRKYDAINNCPGDFLTVVDTATVLDSYKVPVPNTIYGAGNILQIRSNTKEAFYLLGAYINPIVTDLDYSSWIADEQSSAIIYEATSFIFKTIGYDEQNALYRDLVDNPTTGEVAQLKRNYLLINGL